MNKRPCGALHSGNLQISAADLGISSKNENGGANLSIVAHGSSDDGSINIQSNGGAQMVAGNATVSVDRNGSGSAIVDAGVEGKAVVAAGNPALPQVITLDGGAASIKIVNGALPICPTIELSPDSIKLSVGPTSSIVLSPEGVKIEGLIIDVKATTMANLQGAMTSVKGAEMTTIAGAMIMIG